LKVETPAKPGNLIFLTETLTLIAGYLEAKFQNIYIVLEAEMHMEGKAVKQYIKITKPVSKEPTLN
jgi:hypothetical protein